MREGSGGVWEGGMCPEQQTQTQERGATHWAAFYKVLVLIPTDQIKKKKKPVSLAPNTVWLFISGLEHPNLSFLAF